MIGYTSLYAICIALTLSLLTVLLIKRKTLAKGAAILLTAAFVLVLLITLFLTFLAVSILISTSEGV
jgi:uncharacterized membrane protein YozB (DUF420 family)